MKIQPETEVKEEVRKAIRELSRLDNWHSILYLALDLIIVLSMVTLCFMVSFWLYPVAWLFIGSRQRGLANLLHASVHGTLAKNKVWNFISGTFLSGYLIGQQFVRYHYSHVVCHHGKFGDPDVDPDYRQHMDAGLYRNKYQNIHCRKEVYRTLFGVNIPHYLSYVMKARLWGKVPEKYDNRMVSQNVDQILFSSWWAMIAGVFLHLGILHWLFVFWLIPLCTSAMMIGWFIELAEHYPLMSPGVKADQATRNRHGAWFERLLTGVHNDHYHLEHHLNPKVPMWHLPTTNHVRLAGTAYRHWDNQCGGIFSTKDSLGSRRTLMQHIFNAKTSNAGIHVDAGA